MSRDLFEDDFIEFYLDVKKRILESQYRALKNVNLELISLYWDIGKYLNDVQKKKSWRENIVENLSLKLIGDFKGIKGFSVSNLRRMKAFYLSYHNDEILAPLVREISWTKNTIEFLGEWEKLYNQDFNSLEFEGIKNESGMNRFLLSIKQWIEKTNDVTIYQMQALINDKSTLRLEK